MKIPAWLWLAMLLPCVVSLFYFGAIPGVEVSPALYLATKTFTLVWPLVCFFGLAKGRSGFQKSAANGKKSLIWGLVFGALVCLSIWLVFISPIGSLLAEGTPAIREKIQGMGMMDNFILYAVIISTVHAGLEEYYWRWFVFGSLARVNKQPHLWAAVAFAAHHVVVLSTYFGIGWGFALGAMVGFGGWIWSQMYQRTGSIWGAWLSHIMVDAAIMTVGYAWVY